jgi:hypothetical protein
MAVVFAGGPENRGNVIIIKKLKIITGRRRQNLGNPLTKAASPKNIIISKPAVIRMMMRIKKAAGP